MSASSELTEAAGLAGMRASERQRLDAGVRNATSGASWSGERTTLSGSSYSWASQPNLERGDSLALGLLSLSLTNQPTIGRARGRRPRLRL